MSALLREVVFHPAWDKRHPSPSKNYGIHGVDMRMHLIGDEGAVQFVVYTNWHLPAVQEEMDARVTPSTVFMHKPLPADLGYHSKRPMYEGQYSKSDCPLIGCTCYYDGSGLNAERIYDVLLREGSDGVWRELEAYYHETFATHPEQTP